MTIQTRFTQQTQFALTRAVEISAAYNHALINPEHLLLGLLQTPGSAAVSILNSLNVDLQQLAGKVEATFGSRPAPAQGQGRLWFDQGTRVSPEVNAILSSSATEAYRSGMQTVDTRLVLLNLLRQTGSLSAEFLREQNVTVLTAHAATGWPDENRSPAPLSLPAPTWRELPLSISPVFLLLVAVTLAAGALTYQGGAPARLALFVFVTGGWLISVALHEFGHAVVAFLGGDRSVVDKGYLNLNPLNYTHKVLSILMPILFIMIGGIGLPGGAVYINRGAIQKRWLLSLMSAAGPLVTAGCALTLVAPFTLGLANSGGHLEFWAGLALLAFLELSALFLNLLPIPGLDGFGILEPFLPQALLNLTHQVRRFTFFILFIFFFYDTPLRTLFWTGLGLLIWLTGIQPDLITTGFDLYRFWSY